MEIKNKLKVTRGGRRGEIGQRRGGSSQGTWIKDPWTMTVEWVRIECGRSG